MRFPTFLDFVGHIAAGLSVDDAATLCARQIAAAVDARAAAIVYGDEPDAGEPVIEVKPS